MKCSGTEKILRFSSIPFITISPTKEVGISGNLKFQLVFDIIIFDFHCDYRNTDGSPLYLSSKCSDISSLVFIKYGHTVVDTTADFNVFNSLYRLSIIPKM